MIYSKDLFTHSCKKAVGSQYKHIVATPRTGSGAFWMQNCNDALLLAMAIDSRIPFYMNIASHHCYIFLAVVFQSEQKEMA